MQLLYYVPPIPLLVFLIYFFFSLSNPFVYLSFFLWFVCQYFSLSPYSFLSVQLLIAFLLYVRWQFPNTTRLLTTLTSLFLYFCLNCISSLLSLLYFVPLLYRPCKQFPFLLHPLYPCFPLHLFISGDWHPPSCAQSFATSFWSCLSFPNSQSSPSYLYFIHSSLPLSFYQLKSINIPSIIS